MRRGGGTSVDVKRTISELRSELEWIEQEIFILERADIGADRRFVQFVLEMDGASTLPM
jgi:hypothetical protein